METIWAELTRGITSGEKLAVILIRLTAAVVLGAAIGYERQRAGKAAGMRTHILVMFGTCVFVVSSYQMSWDGTSRIIQGIITGIGFLGAGAILKSADQQHVQGLTTAASIWITAAIGVTIGVGVLGIAIISTALTLVVLTLLKKLEYRTEAARESKDEIRE
jgi:putative Mg2+ transporter-C (MgtC) family protein